MYGNENASFNVSYLSSQSTTSVVWLFDGVMLPRTFGKTITTQVINDTLGTSMLQFNMLTRADKGMYTVIVDNSDRFIPRERSSLRINFNVNVYGTLKNYL